jgi:microcystin degradation protein MlrC
MRERGIEAAGVMRELLAGTRTNRVRLRLPIVPPTVTMLTAAGPYAEMIQLGQKLIGPEIVNVSVMGGFAYADTAKNGLSVIVTARNVAARSTRSAAEKVAREIADYGWAQRARFYPKLTPLEEAVQKALAVGRDASLPALAFADVADNPGGGGRGNTMYLLRAFAEAGVKGALLGMVFDPALAVEAHRYGVHYKFDARFNRDETTNFSEPWSTPARVVALSDGNCVGRRGIYAGTRLRLGPCAALAIGGITVVVASHRTQCADPVFFEMLGLDIAKARAVAVKSRGHFRGGFDEFFKAEQIVEVDLPGLTSPMLNRFAWTRLPRPVIPLDEGVEFGLS